VSSLAQDVGLDLPGFHIQKEIGRGGMARVYLAVQKKFGRLVALKVVSESFTSDSRFKERFIRESRINARLTHPNIVQVYDVGDHGKWLYLVLEYVRSGDLNQRLDRGMHMLDLVQVIQDICRALDYAHSKGFVHRDIKPENILFREDGSAVLSDFGIARIADSNPTITRVGTVVGTPQYMSPEQASGRELDGRSDLYSLGVVFYRMLTGDVPYRGDSAVSIGVKHLQEPIPRLPNYLKAFQGVVDKCLAKRPEQRFQTGQEFSDALEAVRAQTQLPNATIKSKAVSTQEIQAIGASLLTTPRDSKRAERRSRNHQRRRRVMLVVNMMIGAALLITAGGYVLVEQPPWATQILSVAGVIEDPTVRDAWSDARSLGEDPNQGLAAIVAGYRRVLDLDPDHVEARQALDGVASQWREDFVAALNSGDLDQAETKLAETAAAFPNDPDLVALQTAIDNRRHAETLLTSTQALLRSHGMSDIPSATAAIQTYKEVLRLAPGHPTALAELDVLARHYASLAAEAADEGDLDSAINFLDRASAASSQMASLDDVRDRIREATTLQTAIVEMQTQAGELRVGGALINPPGENAAELYHRILAADPDNEIAVQGLKEVESQVLGNARQMLALGELVDVQALVARAAAIDLNPVTVSEMKSELDAEVTRIDTVAGNIKEAEALLTLGFITQPAEANAVALLRDVERLDPGNLRARELLTESAERLAAVAIEAHAVGFVEDAKQYLDLALTVTPDVTAWRELRADWEENAPTS
jgi:tetratricopeptide (TPR) repeat protein